MADRVFGPDTASQEVYEVAARPVVKAAMEGVNGAKRFLKFTTHTFFELNNKLTCRVVKVFT